jgi:hypothetical protein
VRHVTTRAHQSPPLRNPIAFTLSKSCRSTLLAALSCAAIAGFACAARTEQHRATPAEPLVPRVEAYWKRREAKDLAGAYTFYCSSYKTRVPQAEFLSLTRLTRFDIRDVRVAPVVEATERIEVTVSFRFIAPPLLGEPIESQTKEWWAREADGQWCKEDEPLVLPFPRSPGL